MRQNFIRSFTSSAGQSNVQLITCHSKNHVRTPKEVEGVVVEVMGVVVVKEEVVEGVCLVVKEGVPARELLVGCGGRFEERNLSSPSQLDLHLPSTIHQLPRLHLVGRIQWRIFSLSLGWACWLCRHESHVPPPSRQRCLTIHSC